MDSTSYAEDKTKHGLDQFAWLKIQLERASRKGEPVYVLGISRENHIDHLEETLTRLKNLPGVYDAVPMNGTIGCIATGCRKDIEELARQVYITSYGDKVGCAQYDEEDRKRASGPYGKIRKAIRTAHRNNEQWHFYDKTKDSFKVLMAKAEANIKAKKIY